MILDQILNELFGFGEKKPEKKAYKGDIGKPYPGTKKEYERALECYVDNKRGKYNYIEQLFELYVFNYNEKTCIEIAKHNIVSSSELYDLFDEDEKKSLDAKLFFKKNKLGVLTDEDSEGYYYSPSTNKWYYHNCDDIPEINPNKPISFSSIMSEATKRYNELMKDYSI